LRVVGAVGLATATWILLAMIRSFLPYSRIGDRITDLFAIPGAWLTSFIYPEGFHTGQGSLEAVWMTMFSNFVVYILFWYLFLIAWGAARHGKGI